MLIDIFAIVGRANTICGANDEVILSLSSRKLAMRKDI